MVACLQKTLIETKLSATLHENGGCTWNIDQLSLLIGNLGVLLAILVIILLLEPLLSGQFGPGAGRGSRVRFALNSVIIPSSGGIER